MKIIYWPKGFFRKEDKVLCLVYYNNRKRQKSSYKLRSIVQDIPFCISPASFNPDKRLALETQSAIETLYGGQFNSLDNTKLPFLTWVCFPQNDVGPECKTLSISGLSEFVIFVNLFFLTSILLWLLNQYSDSRCFFF